MKTAVFIIGYVFLFKFTEKTSAEAQLEGFVDAAVKTECRDRYLWIHVTSALPPRFEAVDGNGVHSISEHLASPCGYTISTFKMDGFTTFRASYYSCFTHNQNDEVFTFSFNVIVSDADGMWISRPVSAVCSGLIWTHREIICEEDYMEVNVNRESSCGGQRGDSGQVSQAAFSQAQRTASSAWQLMFLQSEGRVSSMSISEAQRWGYSLTTSDRRVVLRSRYKQTHAELTMVDGVPMEVVRVSLFSKQKLTVVMIDVSMACTVNSGSFDGAWLLWDVPRVLTPLVAEGAGFESQTLGLGVEGVLLDEPTIATRGFSVVQQGPLIQIGVPFGAEGGYRKSLVVNNVYKEIYVIFLMYQHVFSLLYEEGGSIETRYRMLRVLDTPLLCRPPFHLDQTMSDQQVFSIYLGNIPADVMLEEVRINGYIMSESTQQGYSISPVTHTNGSRAYKLQLSFDNPVVHWMYLGQGVVKYSIDVNSTLTIMPQRDSYYHHTFITAQVLNAFPPEITAQCSDKGISFSVVRPSQAESLWEVGVDHEPLTSQLAAQRGYRLHNDTDRTSLEVPVFSVGFTYEDINLSNFYGTFKLLLRDSKTLEVQTSTSKRCLFKTEDMMVCSADGTMTVVTTPTSTWPTVQPETTTLLDPMCGPKQNDGSRVLFEFKVDSCGTRSMVGELYMVYENEILHDRQLIADGPNFISRESQFKLTVRCFYPLSGVNRLSVDRILRSPGYGSVKVFQSLKAGPFEKLPAKDCLHQVTKNNDNTPTKRVYQTTTAGGVLPHSSIGPGPSHFITVPGGHNKLLPNLNPSPSEGKTSGTQGVPLPSSSRPGPLMSQIRDQHVLGSQIANHLPNIPHRYDQLPDHHVQESPLPTLNYNFVEVTSENSGLTDPALGLSSSSGIPVTPVVEHFGSDWGSSGQTQTLQGPNVWHTWDQNTLGLNGIIKPNQDLQSLNVDPSSAAILDLIRYGSSGSGMDIANTEDTPGYQPQSHTHPSRPSPFHPVLQPSPQSRPDIIGNGEYVPVNAKGIISKSTVSDPQGFTATSQVTQNQERTGIIGRRNIETVQSRVKNVRVKPLSQFASSGLRLNQEPIIPSQYATGLTAVSSDMNPWMSQQIPGHRGSTITHVPERTGLSKLKQEQGVHGAGIRLTGLSPKPQEHEQQLVDPSPNQQEHQQELVDPSLNHQELVQSVAPTGNSEYQESLRNFPQPTGASHIRVKLFPRLTGRLQPYNELKPPSGSTRTSYITVAPQNIPNTKPNSNKGLNPTAWGAGLTGTHTPNGSGSDLKIHRNSDCSGQYGASVHQGIVRDKRIS